MTLISDRSAKDSLLEPPETYSQVFSRHFRDIGRSEDFPDVRWTGRSFSRRRSSRRSRGLGDLPAEPVCGPGDPGGLVKIGLFHIVGRLVIILVDAREEEDDRDSLPREVGAIGPELKYWSALYLISRPSSLADSSASVTRLVWLAWVEEGVTPIDLPSVPADHVDVDVGDDLVIARQRDVLREPSAASSPFSSPETQRKATLRAGLGPSPKASAISSRALVPDALSSEPLKISPFSSTPTWS